MKRKCIAFLYNVRHRYPDPKDPRVQLETDFDDPETIIAIIKHLKGHDYEVLAIEADEKAYGKLLKNREKIDLVFNYSEGIFGADRELQMPAILEMLQIPYTGSKPLTQALVFNKSKTKEVLMANNIPTLPFQLVKNIDEKMRKDFDYPVIVKPVAQGSSSGITTRSVVFNQKQFSRQVKEILTHFDQPALVEPYLEGREFSIAMLGNPPKVLAVIESDHKQLPKKYLGIDSLEVKWIFEEKSEINHLICPAKISKNFYKKLEKICVDTCEALGILDWCRIDIRCDEKGKSYVLEVNSPAGIIPPEVSMTSYFPMAGRAVGLSYKELIKKIINLAFKRYNNNK